MDVAWFDHSKIGGIRWAICDSRGCLIRVKNTGEIKWLEALAIVEGLKKLTETQFAAGDRTRPPLVVESDSSDVIEALIGESLDLSEVSTLLEEISSLQLDANVVDFVKCN